MSDVLRLVVDEMQARGVAKTEKYIPFFVSSIGAHLLNIRNWSKTIMYEGGLPYDFRSHIFFVSPSGFSKSFFQHQFLLPTVGLLEHTLIDHKYLGYVTEAGWVGTVRFVNGNQIVVPGICLEHRYAVLGCEEFSALSNAMKAQYSQQLDTSLLTSLDRGLVQKRLGAGEISEQTHVTLWAGTQPARFDLTSGLGRRFLFLLFIPTREDVEMMKEARRKALGLAYEEERVKIIREGFNEKQKEAERIEEVLFSPDVYDYLDKFRIAHYEEPLYERFLAGYTFMRKDIERVLTVELDDVSKRMIELESEWRYAAQKGAQSAQIEAIVRDYGGKLQINQLREAMLTFGYDFVTSSNLIYDLIRIRVLRYNDGYVEVG